MAKLRIFQIAAELNISHTEILSFLKDKGIQVDSHMAPVDEEIYHIILNEFYKDKKSIERYRREQARRVRREVQDTRIKELQKKKKKLELLSLEDQRKLEVEQQQDLFKPVSHSSIPSSIIEQEVVTGRVIGINEKEVLIDIGFKTEGIISRDEFADNVLPAVGEKFDVFVEKIEDENGKTVLSKEKADFHRRWTKLRECYEKGEIISGHIVNRINRGMQVDLNGVQAFLPESHIDIQLVTDFDQYVDEDMDFKIIDFDESRKNVVVSHKIILENDLWENIEKRYPKEAKINGKVVNITHFGCFIELEPGIEGLLHISEMSWIRRLKHPSEIYSLGDEVEAVILNIDNKKRQIGLGVKQLTIDPWKKINEDFPIGKIINGKVLTKKEPGMLYIQLENGLMALLHLWDLDWVYPLAELRYEKIQIEENIKLQVVEIDPINRQLSVGIKQMTENPIYKKEWQSLKLGDSIQGEIYKPLENYSIVKISEVIYGKLLHQVKVSNVGQKIELVVSSKNIESGLIEVVYPENVIKVSSSEEKAIQDHKLHKTKFTPFDLQFRDINRLKRSEYWNFIDIVGQDYLTKAFANNSELLSKVFKKEMVLHIWFDPLDQKRVWDRFTKNIVPAIIEEKKYKDTEEEIKNALDIISKQDFWYLQFEQKGEHKFNLFNDDLNLYGIITEDSKFILLDIKNKSHRFAKKDKVRLAKRTGAFSLNNPIIVHHKYDNILDSGSLSEIASLLERKELQF